MNNNCKFAGGGYCLCSACEKMREALEQVEKTDVKKLFDDPEIQKLFEDMLKAGEKNE